VLKVAAKDYRRHQGPGNPKGIEEKPDHYEVLQLTEGKMKLEVEASLVGKTIKGGKAESDKQ
jgi:hypothetical protein